MRTSYQSPVSTPLIRKANVHQRAHQATLPPLQRDVVEVRFGKMPSIEQQARNFSQTHGRRLHQPIVECRAEEWNLFAQSPEASLDRLEAWEQKRLFDRLNTPAHDLLLGLLKPENLSQMTTPWLGAHLEHLKKAGYIQPDNLHTRQFVQSEAEVKMIEIRLKRLEQAGQRLEEEDYPTEERFLKACEELETTYKDSVQALIRKRNALAKAHRLPGVQNFYDLILARQNLTAEMLDRFFDETESQIQAINRKLERFSRKQSKNAGIPVGWENTENLLREKDLKARAVVLAFSRVIGQSRHLENIFRNSILDADYGQLGVAGLVMAVDPPRRIHALGSWPDETIRSPQELSTLMHEVAGHGLLSSLLDPKLPPQFRDSFAFADLVEEGMGCLLQKQIYEEPFWTDVLGYKPEQVATIKKSLAAQRWMSLSRADDYRSFDTIERRIYTGEEAEPWEVTGGLYLTDNPVYRHNYALGIAWGAQLEAAMKKKHGSLITAAAWKEMEKVFSLGKLLDWQEQIKLLTSTSAEINRITRQLRGPHKDFLQGKQAIKSASGEYFSTKALYQEMEDLVAILYPPA